MCYPLNYELNRVWQIPLPNALHASTFIGRASCFIVHNYINLRTSENQGQASHLKIYLSAPALKIVEMHLKNK